MDLVTLALARKYTQNLVAQMGLGISDIIPVEDSNALLIELQDGTTATFTFPTPKDGIDGLNGKSAYEMALDSGFKGSLEAWLKSLKGEPGINGKDGRDGKDGNTYTITPTDYNEIAIETEKKVDYDKIATEAAKKVVVPEVFVPTQTSELTNNSGYITLNDLPENLSNIDDVQVNGISVVANRVANINLDTEIGKTFHTTVGVGYLPANTEIKKDMTIADLLCQMLGYREDKEILEVPENIDLSDSAIIWIGVSSERPLSINDIEHYTTVTYDKDELQTIKEVGLELTQNVKTFNEYAVFACTSNLELISCTVDNALNYTNHIISRPMNGYNLYYIDTKTTNMTKGIDYTLTFD